MTGWNDTPTHPALLPPDTVLAHAEHAVIVTDRFSNLLYANPFAERLFGFRAATHIGRSILDLAISEEDRELAIELARQVLRGNVWDGTFSNVRTDGTRVYVRAYAVPLRHPSGKIGGVVISAHEAMKRSNQRELDRFGLLELIGERLAGSLELAETLRRVAETLVPQFADHCAIDLFTGDKLVRRLSMHTGGCSPPESCWPPVGAKVSYPRDHHCAIAMRRLETVLVADATPRHAAEAELRGVRLTSLIAAPLCARGELLGVMTLGLSDVAGREDLHYDGFDRDFVGATASRVALSIDNAMLFEEERNTALAFQHALLPRDIPKFDGLETACTYFPAKPLETHGQGIQTQVGGDWYDVIPLSAGRVGIVIGDVEGRGPRAAAIMGQLRAALRAFAQDDMSPADILRKLDEWVRLLGTPETDAHGRDVGRVPIVTCTYMVYDAWSRQLAFATAGHAQPLLLADGAVNQMEVASKGVPLGVRAKGVASDVMYTEEVRTLPPGTTLVLYTDGLVDRRPRDDGTGGYYTHDEALDLLRERVGEVAHKSVQEIATAAVEAVPGDIDDDVAILVIRSSVQDLDAVDRTFPAEPIMVSEARRVAADTFVSWEMAPEQVELACLLVSEVVTNVVLHTAAAPRRELVPQGLSLDLDDPLAGLAEGWGLPDLNPSAVSQKEFRLRLRRGASAVWVEVFDHDMRLPRIRSAGENDEGGRGLYLVDQLATRWGSRPTQDGKAVWFELPIAAG